MKKSVLLLVVASVLLSGCDKIRLVSSGVSGVTTYYSFTKEALEKCGSFKGSEHSMVYIKDPKYKGGTSVVFKRYGSFIGAKGADGRREVINYGKVDWSLPESRKLEKEEPGTYFMTLNILHNPEGEIAKYDLKIKCQNTGELFTRVDRVPQFSDKVYHVDVKDGKILIDFYELPKLKKLFKAVDGYSEDNVKYYVEELYPINIP